MTRKSPTNSARAGVTRRSFAAGAGATGLLAGTALVIYPVEGKLVFRRMLSGGAVDAFLAYLAR